MSTAILWEYSKYKNILVTVFIKFEIDLAFSVGRFFNGKLEANSYKIPLDNEINHSDYHLGRCFCNRKRGLLAKTYAKQQVFRFSH